jgi:hypothetical protein
LSSSDQDVLSLIFGISGRIHTFTTMKAGVFYILFAIFALFVVSSKQTSNKPLDNATNSCQSVSVSADVVGMPPVASFSLKKVIATVSFSSVFNQTLFDNSSSRGINPSVSSLLLYQNRTIAFKPPLQQKPLLLLLYCSRNNDDDHHLIG